MTQSAISFVAVGDVFLNSKKPESVFGPFANLIRAADVALCDLEGPCSDLGTPVIGKLITMRMPVNAIPALGDAGFDVAVVANNHILDYGYEAFHDTLQRVRNSGMVCLGGGMNLDEARRHAILERNGLRLGILSYATTIPWAYDATSDRPGISPIHVQTYYEPRYQLMSEQPGMPAKIVNIINPDELALLQQQIRMVKQATDAVVVSLHWGVAYTTTPVPYQPELARAAIDAGADLVVGHHPHILQGVEIYRGTPIFYSLSHSFYERENPRFGREMVFLTARFGPKGLERVAVRPAIIASPAEPRPLVQKEREPFIALLERLSDGMNSRFEWEGEEIIVTEK